MLVIFHFFDEDNFILWKFAVNHQFFFLIFFLLLIFIESSSLLLMGNIMQRGMDQKFMSVVLHSGIQFVRILLKHITYLQILLLTSVSVLFHACQVSKSLRMHLRKYFPFAFPLVGVGEFFIFCSLDSLW